MRITDKYVFFWNGIYSQWYIVPMIIDKEVLEEINPREHKVLGRKIKGFDKSVWDKVCLSIVYKGNLHKFKQNLDLLKELKDTENRMLVEASPLDNIWGIGMAENDEGVENPINWKGLNLLGQAINLVKQEIL